jgi:hypothetical protein
MRKAIEFLRGPIVIGKAIEDQMINTFENGN